MRSLSVLGTFFTAPSFEQLVLTACLTLRFYQGLSKRAFLFFSAAPTCPLFKFPNRQGNVAQTKVVIDRFSGEFIHAVVLVINSLRVIHFKTGAPQKFLCRVVGAYLDNSRKKRPLIFVIRVVNIVDARLRVVQKLLYPLRACICRKIVHPHAVVFQRQHTFYLRKALCIYRTYIRDLCLSAQRADLLFVILIHDDFPFL